MKKRTKKLNGIAKVDKGIPIPRDSRGHAKWPWRALKVGDSFLMPGRTAAGSGAHASARRLGIKITQRSVPGGIRIWRVK